MDGGGYYALWYLTGYIKKDAGRLLVSINICSTKKIVPLQLFKLIIIFLTHQLLKVQEITQFFKILLSLYEPQVLKSVALVCPEGGDLAAAIPDSWGNFVHFLAF